MADRKIPLLVHRVAATAGTVDKADTNLRDFHRERILDALVESIIPIVNDSSDPQSSIIVLAL